MRRWDFDRCFLTFQIRMREDVRHRGIQLRRGIWSVLYMWGLTINATLAYQVITFRFFWHPTNSVTLGCGGSSSQNMTYLEQSSTTTALNCEYTLCPCAASVCRIRFDFTTMVLAGPFLGTSGSGAAATAPQGGNIGDCVTDQFSITGTPGTPVICGTNTGQHSKMKIQFKSRIKTNTYRLGI